jgi:hypothetical protein
VSNEGRERENGYRAFISYSHRDDAAATSLHKRLETYRLPKKLIGQAGERGPIPERLTPIFRDLDELSAADDLTVEIKAALARSATLIVLCSPGAKASKWVNLEIETFRALHGSTRPVLAALIEGEPADAFPPALTADGHEPVAADFRKSRDGKRLALLKLVAGMAGAPLDALVQRDAQRQLRRVTAITVSALTAVVAMALLLVVALRAQSEAERQRQEAEGLVEYMLTDLRDKLKGVGRLDVMTAVNERAMQYYGGQEALEGLPAESLERRARILHAMGEDDLVKGRLSLALNKFKEANRITAALFFQKPDQPTRIFAHAQSEYWVGRVYELKKDWRFAAEQYQKYADKSQLLVNKDSKNPKYIMEMGWGHLNRGIIQADGYKNFKSAEEFFLLSLHWFRIAEKLSPNDQSIKYEIANNIGWLADSYFYRKKFYESIDLRIAQIKIQELILKKDFYNNDSKFDLAISERSLSINLYEIGQYNKSKIVLTKSIEKLEFLRNIDRSNKLWSQALIEAYVKMNEIEKK